MNKKIINLHSARMSRQLHAEYKEMVEQAKVEQEHSERVQAMIKRHERIIINEKIRAHTKAIVTAA